MGQSNESEAGALELGVRPTFKLRRMLRFPEKSVNYPGLVGGEHGFHHHPKGARTSPRNGVPRLPAPTHPTFPPWHARSEFACGTRPQPGIRAPDRRQVSLPAPLASGLGGGISCS